MTTTSNEKTPGAQLAGESTEGLENPTTMKEQENMTSLPAEIPLDEGSTIEIAPYEGGGIELYAIIGPSTIGVALTDQEAQTLATTLLDTIRQQTRPVAPVEIPVSDLAAGTVTDVFRFATDHDMPPGDVMDAVENYIEEMSKVERLSPAQWCKRYRQSQNR